MELIEAIKGRRSIRQYNPDPIPRGESKDSYNKMFRETLTGFIEKHGRDEAGSASWTLEIMEKAPVLVIVWNINKYGWPTEEHSVAAAMQNICLRAYDLGLGSLWIGDIFYAYNET